MNKVGGGGGRSHKWLLPLWGRELCGAQHCSQMLLIKCSFLRPGKKTKNNKKIKKTTQTSSLFPLHKHQMLLGRALVSPQHSPAMGTILSHRGDPAFPREQPSGAPALSSGMCSQGDPRALKPKSFQVQAKARVPTGKSLSRPNSLLSVK